MRWRSVFVLRRRHALSLKEWSLFTFALKVSDDPLEWFHGARLWLMPLFRKFKKSALGMLQYVTFTESGSLHGYKMLTVDIVCWAFNMHYQVILVQHNPRLSLCRFMFWKVLCCTLFVWCLRQPLAQKKWRMKMIHNPDRIKIPAELIC